MIVRGTKKDIVDLARGRRSVVGVRKIGVLAMSLGVLGVLAPATRVDAEPMTILPGDDVLTTTAGTQLKTLIPTGFFGSLSDSISGIPLVGVSLGVDFGDADTLVARLDPVDLPTFPFTADPIRIEIVALNLASDGPITVTFNGGQDPEEWNVRVCLTDGIPQPLGTMTITRTHENGGTFVSELHVTATAEFTQVASPFTVLNLEVVDDILLPVNPPISWVAQSSFGVTVAPGVQVVSECGGTTKAVLGTSSNFKVGVSQQDPGAGPNSCQVLDISDEEGDSTVHNFHIPGFPDASCCIKNGTDRGKCKEFIPPNFPNDPDAFGASDCQDAGNDVVGGDGASCTMETGACCMPDDTCVDGSNKCCCELLGGTFMGDASKCLGDSDGDGADDLCVPPIPTVSQWGLVAITLLMLTAGTVVIRRWRVASAGA